MPGYYIEADEGEFGTIKIPNGFKGKFTRVEGGLPPGILKETKFDIEKEVKMSDGFCKDCIQKDREIDKRDREIDKLRDKFDLSAKEISERDTRLRDLETNLRGALDQAQKQLAERDLKFKEQESALENWKVAASRSDKLAQELEALKNREFNWGDLPPLKSYIAHCEEGGNCSHGQEWQEVKRDIITQALEHLPDDFLRRKALEKNIIPKNIKIEVP